MLSHKQVCKKGYEIEKWMDNHCDSTGDHHIAVLTMRVPTRPVQCYEVEYE